MKHGQFKIKKALGAPSVPVAFMGLLLGRMVQKDKMDQATATHILANEMQLGDIAAQGIVQRGIEFLQQQERTP